MPSKRNQDIEELLLEAYRKGVEQAIDLSSSNRCTACYRREWKNQKNQAQV